MSKLKLDKKFFENMDPSQASAFAKAADLGRRYKNKSDAKVTLERIPMFWDKELTRVDKINVNEQDIIMALDNLKELGVPRRVVIRFLIQEIKDIFRSKQ